MTSRKSTLLAADRRPAARRPNEDGFARSAGSLDN
jgi:hypothetical protein